MSLRVVPVSPMVHLDICAVIHGTSFERPWDAQSIGRSLSLPGAFAHLVIDDSQGPVGFGLYQLKGDSAEVFTIAVIPEARRLGIGSLLLDAAETVCRKQGAWRILLDVAEDNPTARALYAQSGYIEVNKRKGYYPRANRPAVAALVMAKRLNRN
jgi:ribosomal-protein-alanine N-acetyltransferase